jgi:hypothetical protein
VTIRGPYGSTPQRLTEQAFQRQVCDLAELHGWAWVHAARVTVQRPRRGLPPITYTETPLKGPLGRGWPDLTLVRERVVYAELKADDGRMSPEQVEVRERLRDADAEWYCWRPRDWSEIVAVLSERRP